MIEVLKRIKYLAHQDLKNKDIFRLLASLTAEVGEVSDALLIEEGVAGNTYKNLPSESSMVEAADAAICSLAIFFARGGTIENLGPIMSEKLDKWERNS